MVLSDPVHVEPHLVGQLDLFEKLSEVLGRELRRPGLSGRKRDGEAVDSDLHRPLLVSGPRYQKIDPDAA